jgi:[ribosomal protein S18]-alanine N-acetyltransferase
MSPGARSDLPATPPGVRAALAPDLAQLSAIEAAAFAAPWGELALALWLAPGGRGAAWLVADPSAAAPRAPSPPAVGFALFALGPGETELLRVAVLPGHRGRGLARTLLEIALAELAAGGRPDCHLEVRATNRAAIALYARLGFAPSGRRRAYYPDGEDALLFRRGARPADG